LRGDGHTASRLASSEISEEVDLDLACREEILSAAARAGAWTHWEALGLPWNSSAEAARAAYLEEVKRFHRTASPARARELREKLERVFRRITEAKDVLADEGGEPPTRADRAPRRAPSSRRDGSRTSVGPGSAGLGSRARIPSSDAPRESRSSSRERSRRCRRGGSERRRTTCS
jgi:curved DNA-binding protein CbpA